MICRFCKEEYDKKEVGRVLGKGSSSYVLNYCSAQCYTKGGESSPFTAYHNRLAAEDARRMTKAKAIEIIKGIHMSADYYNLFDESTCLDGTFSAQELKAIAYVMENKLSGEVKTEIREFFKKLRE